MLHFCHKILFICTILMQTRFFTGSHIEEFEDMEDMEDEMEEENIDDEDDEKVTY